MHQFLVEVKVKLKIEAKLKILFALGVLPCRFTIILSLSEKNPRIWEPLRTVVQAK